MKLDVEDVIVRCMLSVFVGLWGEEEKTLQGKFKGERLLNPNIQVGMNMSPTPLHLYPGWV